MNMTFRQLRLLLTLAETNNISATALRLHITQPTASMQLKEMAHNIGLPIYEVVGKKIFLTDAGQELVQTARTILDTWDGFEQKIHAIKGLSRGKLKIAVVSTAQYFMPDLIGQFCRQYPEIDIALEIHNRNGIVQRLHHHLDDLYIMSMPPTDMRLEDQILMPNPLVMIAPTSDPLTNHPLLTLSDLQTKRFILREKGSGTRMLADQFFSSQHFKPDIRLELGSNEAIQESVAAELGIGVISYHALQSWQKQTAISQLHVEGFPLPSAWHIVHASGKKLSPLALAFKQHLLATVSHT